VEIVPLIKTTITVVLLKLIIVRVILIGDICKKKFSETIITNNKKTVLLRENVKDHQHIEDNDERNICSY